MPTPMTHGLVGAAIAQAAPESFSKPKVAVAYGILGLAPDLDIAGFHLGVPFGHILGHRGLSHSLAFAFFVGVIAVFTLYWSEMGSLRDCSRVPTNANKHLPG